MDNRSFILDKFIIVVVIQLRNSKWEIHFALFKQLKHIFDIYSRLNVKLNLTVSFCYPSKLFHDDLMVILFLSICEGVGHQWCSRSLSVTDARTVDSLLFL